MAANNSYGYSNDGYRSSYQDSNYPRTTSTSNYSGRNMQNYSYSEDVKYPKGYQNSQSAGYGGHQNYVESNQGYGARKDNQTQQSGYGYGRQESNTYENKPSSSTYDFRQDYEDVEPPTQEYQDYQDYQDYQEYDHYTEENRGTQKGSWNKPTWDMNRDSSYSSGEPVSYPETSSSYHQQSNRFGQGSWTNKDSKSNGASTRYAKNSPYVNKDMKLKAQPKPPQLHYCEICKISCAGYQTYKEHLEGQKHKKKELTGTAQTPVKSAPTQLHCQLCDISCTGPDAYAAHMKGAKHQKVVKLHTRLGKPIPDSEPVPKHTSESSTKSSTGVQKRQHSLAMEYSDISERLHSEKPARSSTYSKQNSMFERDEAYMDAQDVSESDAQPIGEHFVEEVRNEEGKIIRFHCKLCECSFNDANARDMHLKGRRHTLQFKKKVNPRISVEMKASNRPRRVQDDKGWRRWEHAQAMQRYLKEEQMWFMEMRRYEDMYRRKLEDEYMFWQYQQRRRMQQHPVRGRQRYMHYNSPPAKQSADDQNIMRKHAQIYPTEKELEAIQKTVSVSERALKLVADCIRNESNEKGTGKSDSACVLRGVKRVGILSKGLILRDNQDFELTLLCSSKPTCSLLKRIAELLPEQLETLSKKQHSVTYNMEEAQLLITFSDEPNMRFTVYLTCSHLFAKNSGKKGGAATKEDTKAAESSNTEGTKTEEDTKAAEDTKVAEDTMEVDAKAAQSTKEIEGAKEAENDAKEEDLDKEEDTGATSEENDLLSEEKCKESLIRLHQAQWFQSCGSELPSCVIVIRIFRDLRQRVPAWNVLSDWALELIIQTAISSASVPLSPAEATQRVLECIASGLLLPGGPGLGDPCQKEACDVLKSLTNQECEDITANAQHLLRMISFRQIHKVLGIEPLKVVRQISQKRKRPQDSSESGAGQEKKEKKENVEEVPKESVEEVQEVQKENVEDVQEVQKS